MSERARLIWLMCLPHTDREGRIPGDPHEILARCLPMAGLHVSDVEARVDEIILAGMWRRYTDDRGRKVIVFGRFGDYQSASALKDEKRSKWSDPEENSWDPEELGGTPPNPEEFLRTPPNSKELLPEENRSKSKRREENSSAPARAKSEDQANQEQDNSKSNGVDTIGCRNAEWPYARGQILDDFRAAINRFEWGPSAVDEAAGKKAVDLLQALHMRVTQMRVAYDRAMSDGKKHTHLFADTVQELRNGDCSRSREKATIQPDVGPPSWIEEARKIAPEYFEAREEAT